MDESLINHEHCRICGCKQLNKFHYVADLSNQVGLYQIVRRDGSLDELIRPCECRGEFSHAHKVCLANWIETTKHEYCDICRYRYNIKLIERSFFDWIFETKQVKTSLTILSIALLIYYLGALGILISTNRPVKNILDVLVLGTSYIWISICTLSIIAYCYHSLKEFRCWRANNRRVVVEPNPSPQLDTPAKEKDVLKSSGFKPKDRSDINKDD